jgi:uncharacterized protein (TIGR00251 family)
MALMVEVKVVPFSRRNAWMLDKSGVLKVHLKNPAQRGLANDELITSLAKVLKLSQKDVTIISGLTARNKRLKIEADITYDQFLSALEIEQQLSLFKK